MVNGPRLRETGNGIDGLAFLRTSFVEEGFDSPIHKSIRGFLKIEKHQLVDESVCRDFDDERNDEIGGKKASILVNALIDEHPLF